jgi:hypothetical protein
LRETKVIFLAFSALFLHNRQKPGGWLVNDLAFGDFGPWAVEAWSPFANLCARRGLPVTTPHIKAVDPFV